MHGLMQNGKERIEVLRVPRWRLERPVIVFTYRRFWVIPANYLLEYAGEISDIEPTPVGHW
jgi:hypothetical protein